MKPRRIPLNQRLKRRQHIEIARLQDIAVEAMYRVFPDAVLHGGTAIWRCYSGSRFSEDIDVYIERDLEKIEELFRQFRNAGFLIAKKRIKENSLYSRLVMNRTEIRFEAVFKKVKGTVMEYETYEGISLNVYTLLPEEIMIEKIAAYRKRRKTRDLYDIFFMARSIEDIKKVKHSLKEFLKSFENPVDEDDLKVLILVGISPKADEMLDYLRRWLR